MTRLDAAIAAARAQDVEVSAAEERRTRDRILESVGRRSRGRKKGLAGIAIAFILGSGGLSWAWRSGGLDEVVEAARAPVTLLRARPAMQPAMAARAPTPAPLEAPVHPPPPPVVEAPVVEAPVVAPPVARTAHRRHVDRSAELYRRAHELHFHGDDPAAALAAFDAYLAAAPAGGFAVDARYDRALDLVKLGRLDEARAALQPFADGEVAPTGYRQREARGLIAAIAARSR